VADGRRAIGWREVLIVAAIAVAAVLAVDALATFVPAIGHVFQSTPLIVVALIVASAILLWRVASRQPPEP
jgi:MFS-type transporter involved in bile tolerance (Atg22 family)